VRATLGVVAAAAGFAIAACGGGTDPVDTRGGIAGRIASGCGAQLTLLDDGSTDRVAEMRRLDARVTRLDRSAARQEARLAEQAKRDDAADAVDAARERQRKTGARRDAARHDLIALIETEREFAGTYDEDVVGCMGTITDWDVASHAVAAALAAPARASGTKHPTVVCDAPVDDPHESGHVDDEEYRTIHLAAVTCFALEFALAHPAALGCAADTIAAEQPACPFGATAALSAIQTLAHEEQHVDGIADEGKADCYAFQRAPEAARAIGVDADAAQFVARVVTSSYDRPAEYHDARCHAGGGLDLGLLRIANWSYT
jgi:hypothetical protein